MLSFDLNKTKVILIGVSIFNDNKLSNLPNVENNVIELNSVFTNSSIIGVPHENVFPIINEGNVTSLLKQLHGLITEDSNIETLFFYYAGHGKVSLERELLLTLSDTDVTTQELTEVTSLPFRFLKSIINQSSATKKIVVLDCCFSGLAIDIMGTEEYDIQKTQIAGTYLITSVAASSYANASDLENIYTEFTGGLIKTLNNGINTSGKFITLDELYEFIKLANSSFSKPQKISTQNIATFKIAINRSYNKKDEFDLFDGGIKTNIFTSISKLSKEDLSYFEAKNGNNGQRFITIKKEYFKCLNIQAGDFVILTYTHNDDCVQEYATVFPSKNTFSISMPLVIRNLINIERNPSDLTIKGELIIEPFHKQKIDFIEVTSNDYISSLPQKNNIKKTNDSIIAIRDLEFNLLGLKENDLVELNYSNEQEEYSIIVSAVVFKNSPGRAKIGISFGIRNQISLLREPYTLKIIPFSSTNT